MLRVMKLSGKYYATEFDIEDEDEIESLKIFTNEATAVILVDDLDDLSSLEISPDEVEMVK